jgi:hypothetical protein
MVVVVVVAVIVAAAAAIANSNIRKAQRAEYFTTGSNTCARRHG